MKPSVPRSWLLLLAGSIWSIVGFMLCRTAYLWLKELHGGSALPLGILGLGMAIGVYRFGFSKIAQKNIERICHIPEKACVFAFQAWRGYLIIGIMITLGTVLRRSPFPKPYLAVVYASIGGALLLASFRYYARFRQMRCVETDAVRGK